jgi:hypothetical protein
VLKAFHGRHPMPQCCRPNRGTQRIMPYKFAHLAFAADLALEPAKEPRVVRPLLGLVLVWTLAVLNHVRRLGPRGRDAPFPPGPGASWAIELLPQLL